jgi:hypothetical protein
MFAVIPTFPTHCGTIRAVGQILYSSRGAHADRIEPGITDELRDDGQGMDIVARVEAPEPGLSIATMD